MRRALALTVGTFWFFSACAQTTDDQVYLPLASALSKLAAAVDAYVIETPGAEQMASDELLRDATSHDKSLLVPFNGHSLRTRVDGRNSSVLLCDATSTRALIEDAGCSPQSDLHA